MSELLDFMAAFSGAKTEEGCRVKLEATKAQFCGTETGNPAYPLKCKALLGGYWPNADANNYFTHEPKGIVAGAPYKPVLEWTVDALADTARSCLGSNATFKDLMSPEGKWAYDLAHDMFNDLNENGTSIFWSVERLNREKCNSYGGNAVWIRRDDPRYETIFNDYSDAMASYYPEYLTWVSEYAGGDPRNVGFCALKSWLDSKGIQSTGTISDAYTRCQMHIREVGSPAASWNGTACVFGTDFAKLWCQQLGAGWTWIDADNVCQKTE
jgi:hypothetical protein